MPGGAIIDAAKSERLVAGLAIATIGCCALAYAAMPIFPVVVAAATLHAAASCVLGPAIAAISLGLVGPLAIGERLGRNARFASLGNGVAAAVMGTAGYLLSSRSVFLVTFLLAIPTLIALSRIREHEVDIARCPRRDAARGGGSRRHQHLASDPAAAAHCLCAQRAPVAARERLDDAADGERR